MGYIKGVSCYNCHSITYCHRVYDDTRRYYCYACMYQVFGVGEMKVGDYDFCKECTDLNYCMVYVKWKTTNQVIQQKIKRAL